MTFVSTATVSDTSYTSPTLQAGDIVVLALSADRAGGPLSVPSGWSAATSEMSLTLPSGGGATGFATTTSMVVWRRAAAAGTLSASFGRLVVAQSVVLRGPTSIAAAESRRVNAADFTYPALSFENPMTGHVVHVGVALDTFGSGPAAAGDTARQSQKVGASGVRNFAGMDVTRYSWLTTGEKTITAVSSVAAASASQRVDGWAVSLAFATVSGPAAPTITTPVAGSVDLAAGFTIAWEPSGEQTGYAIRRELGAGSWAWWNGTDWSASSETIVTSTATTVAVPAAQFSNGGWAWLEVATVGDALRPSLGTYAFVVVLGKAPPTLSSATVSPLTGSNVTSLTPTVTLSGTAGSGGSLSGYRVRVDQDLGDGWVQVLDSGVVASPWTVSVAQAANLTNGAPVRFRSVTVQDGTQEGAVTTSATYTLAHPTPAAPTVAVAQVAHPTSGLPGLRVTITSAATGAVVLYRAGVAVHESAITAGVPLVVDDYSPGAGSVIYSATVTTGDGVSTVRVTSPLGSAGGIAAAASHCWLIDELDPATAVQLHIASEGAQGHELHTAVFTPLGQAARLVHTGTPTLPDGSTVLTIDTPDVVTAALALLTSGRRLTLRGAPTETDPSTGIEYPNPARRLYVVGTPTVEREHAGPWTHRLVSFDWVSAP